MAPETGAQAHGGLMGPELGLFEFARGLLGRRAVRELPLLGVASLFQGLPELLQVRMHMDQTRGGCHRCSQVAPALVEIAE